MNLPNKRGSGNADPYNLLDRLRAVTDELERIADHNQAGSPEDELTDIAQPDILEIERARLAIAHAEKRLTNRAPDSGELTSEARLDALQALREIRAVDEQLNRAEEVPSTDDYNQVVEIALDYLASGARQLELPGGDN